MSDKYPSIPHLECLSFISTKDGERVDEVYYIVKSFVREAEVYAKNRGIDCRITYHLFTDDPVNQPLNVKWGKYFKEENK